MRVPELQATIERRVLVNYRVDLETLRAVLPAPFRPATVDGWGVAGICLLRLGDVRPLGVPRSLGLTSENAAHRVAVEWDTSSGTVAGVYIPRRDTSSRVSAIAGGRLFPGWQHLARFTVRERAGERYEIDVRSRDGAVGINVDAHVARRPMAGSVFTTTDAASAFFRAAPVGYAATPCDGVFDGVELGTDGWNLQPMHLDDVASSFFDDGTRFPAGSATPDSAFLMARIATRWRMQPRLVAAPKAEIGASPC